MYDVKRCRMSKEGKEELSRSLKKNFKGNIVGETNTLYRVVWDGSKTPTPYHKDFIEIIPSEANVNAAQEIIEVEKIENILV